MSTPAYARRHRELGLCRNCPEPLAEGSKIFCTYHREKDRVRGRIKSKKEIAQLKFAYLEHYGKTCRCCGESNVEFLTLEHVDGNGNNHRRLLFKHNVGGVHMYRWLKKNNFPKEYAVLCMNCNWAKRISKICPHELRRGG